MVVVVVRSSVFLVGHRASTRAATLHLFDQNYTVSPVRLFEGAKWGEIQSMQKINWILITIATSIYSPLFEKDVGDDARGWTISFHVGR